MGTPTGMKARPAASEDCVAEAEVPAEEAEGEEAEADREMKRGVSRGWGQW